MSRCRVVAAAGLVAAAAVLAAPPAGRAALVVTPDGPGTRPWPGGVIPYEMARGFRQPKAARFAMRTWSEGTAGAVRFVRRRRQRDYVLFRNDQPPRGCDGRSPSGRRGRAQPLVVSRSCPERDGPTILVHEVGHLVGLFHEQGRPDRDRHIRLHLENARFPSQFRIYPRARARPFGPYDVLSIMHYRSRAQSRNGRLVITLRDGSRIPRGNGLPTAGDFRAVRSLYRRPR